MLTDMEMAHDDLVDDALLTTVFEVAKVAICFIDDQGLLLRVNPAFCSLLGYQERELVGVHWTVLAPPHALEDPGRYLGALLKESPRLSNEWPLKRRDGSIITVITSFRTIIRPSGRRVAVVTFTDIDRRMAAERQLRESEARFRAELEQRIDARTIELQEKIAELELAQSQLRRSEERYRNLVENVSEAILIAQGNHLVFVNPRVTELSGFSEDELLAEPFDQLIWPEDVPLVLEHYRRLMLNEPVERYTLFRIRCRDGGFKWVQSSGVFIRWEGRNATLAFLSDLTERKQAEEALVRSEERYRHVVDNVNVGIVVVQNGRFTFVNPALERISGYSFEELHALENVADVVFPDDRERVLDRYAARLRGEPVERTAVFRIVTKQGALCWVEQSAVPIIWEGADAVLSFIADVTERQRLEETLKQSLVERDTILANSLVGIAVLDDKGRLRWINTAMEQIFGTSLIQQPSASMEPYYCSREEYLRVGGEVAESVRAGKAYETELQMRRADGSKFWVYICGKAVNLRDLAQGTVWVVMDISSRRTLEEELKSAYSEREAILQSTPVGVTHTVHRTHQWVNRKFSEMIGFSEEEIIGKSRRLHFPSDESWAKLGDDSEEPLARGESYTAEWQMQRKDGSLVWVQLFGKAIDPADMDQGIIWTLLDITERRQAEEDIRSALEKQRELNMLKSRFVSMTSHEFRTPLATILSSAELLKYYGERLPTEEKSELLGTIEMAVKRMTQMLEDILVIGRAEAGKLEFNPGLLDVDVLCRKLVEETRIAAEQAQEGKHQFEVTIDHGFSQAVLDEKLLRHILGNLLANAVKYSPEGGRISLDVGGDDNGICFMVSDQGIGMRLEDVPRLFETFYRASNVGTISGTGLGLAIVKRAVDLHGGTIKVDSQLGQGTRFVVQLPIAKG